MSAPDRFFIKAGYVTNDTTITMDRVSGSTYWTADRQAGADIFQLHVYRYAEQLARTRKDSCLIDVGCGIGRKLERIHRRLPELQIIGIDQPHAISVCRSIQRFGEWYEDDFESPANLSLPSNPGVIICADVIEHVLNPDLLLDYLRHLAGRSTRILISTPERDRLRGEDCMYCPNPNHVREWNRDEFPAYVESRGFEVLEAKLIPSYPLTLRPTFLARDIRQLLLGQGRRTNQMLVLRSVS